MSLYSFPMFISVLAILFLAVNLDALIRIIPSYNGKEFFYDIFTVFAYFL